MESRYIFPCVIKHDKEDGIFYASFPDIEEAFTDGESLAEAIYNARDVLGLALYEREKQGREIPKFTSPVIEGGKDETVGFVDVWMPIIRDRIGSKSVKKTLTIPRWLDDMATKEGVNFSAVLQAALKDYLSIM